MRTVIYWRKKLFLYLKNMIWYYLLGLKTIVIMIKIVLLQDFSNELGNILKSYEPEKRDILNIDKKESV